MTQMMTTWIWWIRMAMISSQVLFSSCAEECAHSFSLK
jgi:hypothetical protein